MGHGHVGDGDAGDTCHLEHSRAGDAVAGGDDKGAAVDKAAGAASVVGVRSSRGAEAVAAEAKASAVGLVETVGTAGEKQIV